MPDAGWLWRLQYVACHVELSVCEAPGTRLNHKPMMFNRHRIQACVSSAAMLVLSLSVAACVGPLTPVAKVDAATDRQLSATIPVYEPAQTPAGATVIAPITATSCKNKAWDKDPSREDAVSQLRLYAAQRGGNAVGNLICEPPQGTSLATNCWSSMVCRGTAIRLP